MLNQISHGGSKIRLKEIFFDDFLLDSNADGIPDGWAEEGSLLTKTVSNSIFTFRSNQQLAGIKRTILQFDKIYLAKVKFRQTEDITTTINLVAYDGYNNIPFDSYRCYTNWIVITIPVVRVYNSAILYLCRNGGGSTYVTFEIDYIRFYEVIGVNTGII